MRVPIWDACKRELLLDRVPGQASAHLHERHGSLAQRAGADRGPPVEDRRRLAQRAAERLVVRMPPRIADPRRLPAAQLHIDALIQAEPRVGPPQPGLLNTAPW